MSLYTKKRALPTFGVKPSGVVAAANCKEARRANTFTGEKQENVENCMMIDFAKRSMHCSNNNNNLLGRIQCAGLTGILYRKPMALSSCIFARGNRYLNLRAFKKKKKVPS